MGRAGEGWPRGEHEQRRQGTGHRQGMQGRRGSGSLLVALLDVCCSFAHLHAQVSDLGPDPQGARDKESGCRDRQGLAANDKLLTTL